MGWFVSLFANDETAVCSINVCGIAFALTLIGLTISNPAWNPMPFATGAGAILLLVGTGKRVRDGLKPGGQ